MTDAFANAPSMYLYILPYMRGGHGGLPINGGSLRVRLSLQEDKKLSVCWNL